ncbi:MAG: hypothetical protein ACI4KE_07700 [Anaerovoracaceae bacterium]
MKDIKIPILSDKKDVKKFLDELKAIINDVSFDSNDDLIIIKSSKDEVQYSTRYTLFDLDYDTVDVVDRLKELTVSDYSETLIDKDNDKPPLLFVFGKDINNRQVYIKLKIKGENNRRILCLSFHYAKHKMKFPYA